MQEIKRKIEKLNKKIDDLTKKSEPQPSTSNSAYNDLRKKETKQKKWNSDTATKANNLQEQAVQAQVHQQPTTL